MKIKNSLELLCFFSGLAFFCSSLEILIPKPIPFLHFGLANAVIMLASLVLSGKNFFLLLLLKVIGQGLIAGTLLSYVFVFSFFGTFASGTISFILARTLKDKLSFIGISVAGAFASNTAQLLLAYFFVFGKASILFAPAVLIFGLLSSLLLGFFVTVFAEKSLWYNKFFLEEGFAENEVSETKEKACNEKKLPPLQENSKKEKVFFIVKMFLVLAIIISNLFLNNTVFKLFLFLLSITLCLFSKVKVNFKAFFIFAFSILLVNIFQYNGEILFEVFAFKITKGALIISLDKILTFQAMLFFSKWVFSSRINFSGRFSSLLSKSFEVFNQLLSSKNLFDKKNIIASLDKILLSFKF